MLKIDEEEKEILTDKRKNEGEGDIIGGATTEKKKKKTKKNKRRRRKSQDGNENEEENKESIEAKQKSLINSDQFNINNRYHLIKMLGFGSFGEIHLAYDSQTRSLNAIKFELITQKNPQLKHEFNILEQVNKSEGNSHIEGIPKVFLFDRMENKANFMIMEFLGPALSDLFQFKNKQFSLTTVLLLGIQMLQRIEFIHEKGFIHRDIKPENFVLGINEKSNTVYLIDYGLSKRYKDKNTGQHIPYRENRHLIGTARYASLNAHLGIEQSRRDDIESIGYVLVYFLAGRLPWQSKFEKSKLPQKIMEKKLVTPPEILCKKLPMEFSYYFHYCRNLKFEDRPDYSTLKSLFYDLLISQANVSSNTDFMFDWYYDETPFMEDKHDENENPQNQTFAINMRNTLQNTLAANDKNLFAGETPINENFIEDQNSSPNKGQANKNRNILISEDDESNDDIIIKKKKNKHHSNSESSDDDTERLGEEKENNEEEIKKIIQNNSDSNKINNSDSNYNLLQKSSTEKSSKHKKNQESDVKSKADLDDIVIKNSNLDSNEEFNNNEINLVVKKKKDK